MDVNQARCLRLRLGFKVAICDHTLTWRTFVFFVSLFFGVLCTGPLKAAPAYYPPDPPTKPISDLPQTAPEPSRCYALLQIIETKLFSEPDNPNLIAAYKLLLNECARQAMQQAANASPKKNARPGKIQYSLDLRLYQGHQYNPLFASSANQFDLTYPTQTIPVKNNQKNLTANYSGLSLSGTLQSGNSLLVAQAETEKYYDPRVENQLFAMVDYWYFLDFMGVKASVLQNRYQGNYYTQFGVGGLKILPKQILFKVDWMRRLFDIGDELDGDIFSVQFASPYDNWWKLPGRWKVQAGASIDAPINQRAGGQQNRYEIALLYSWQTSAQSWQISQQYAYQQDMQGYSTLLENDAKRHIQILNTQLQWQYLKETAYTPYIQVGYTQQYSNIKLFEWESADIRIGVQIPLHR